MVVSVRWADNLSDDNGGRRSYQKPAYWKWQLANTAFQETNYTSLNGGLEITPVKKLEDQS